MLSEKVIQIIIVMVPMWLDEQEAEWQFRDDF